MAEKSRSLSFFLFVCALLSGVIFYGCGGGGGTSSQHVPLQISGNVTSILPLAGLRADSALSPELRSAASLAGIEVYLESAREMHSTHTDSEGRFLLSGVPAGNHYLIARVLTASGTTLKVRSSQAVAVSDTRPTAMINTPLALIAATASASGKLLDVNNQPVRNGSLTLWGETFFTDSDGIYTTPPMPFNTIASVVVTVPGFQQTAIPVKFTDNPPFIEQTIVNNSATNRPPTSALTANRYTVSPGVSVLLSATASDPDETLDSDNYAWSATIGTFSGSLTGLSANWIAPSENAPATVTFTVTDNGGLVSRSNVGIVVGTGIFVPNHPPTIASLTSSSTDGKHYSTLTYALTASATDIDGNNLTYSWTATSSANAGTISGSGKTANWQTPTVTTPTNVTVTVSVTDGKDSRSLSRTFSVTVDPYIDGNSPPNAVTISLPTPGELFMPGEQISVAGSATDYDPATSQYVDMEASAFTWELIYPTNTVANMATGRSEFLYTLPQNSGNYTIRLTATDKYQAKASSTRQLRINSAPELPVITINQTNPIKIGTVITFTGSATDVEDGSIAPASLTWKFPAPINTWYGNTLATNTIPEGTHFVELSARDSKGVVSATATRQVVVSNTGPTMTIATPAEGVAVVASLPFAISGSGVDVNNAAVNATTMVWELWHTGVATATIASQTATFNHTFDEVGHYVLTLTGKDGASKTGTTQRMFTVNATPSVSITLPASGTRFDLNSEITFAAHLSEPGELQSNLIASWASSLKGHIGLGEPLKYSGLTAGSQEITCEVINTRSGLSTSTSTMILVNTLPVGTLTFNLAEQYATAPGNIPIFLSTNSAMNITMTMTATDIEDGALTGNSIEWFLKEGNNEIALTTGKDVTRAFSPGLHNIVVRVYDSFRPGFEDQASATYNTSFYVWQSRTLALADPDITYMHGDVYDLHMTRSVAKEVKKYTVTTGLNPYFSAIATSSLASFTTLASASVVYDSKYLTLGVTVAGGAKLSTDSAYLYSLTGGNLNGAISVAYSGDPTMGYLACNTRLTKFNPASGNFEEDITTAAGSNFNGLYRIRVADGGAGVGMVFAPDTLNNRIVRYLEPSLASPIVTAATAPTDVAVVKLANGAYVMSLSNVTGVTPVSDAGKISINLVTGAGSTYLMRFGDGTSSTAGKLNTPLAIHYNNGDLFVLEKVGGVFQIHMIRSGMSNWLSGTKLSL